MRIKRMAIFSLAWVIAWIIRNHEVVFLAIVGTLLYIFTGFMLRWLGVA